MSDIEEDDPDINIPQSDEEMEEPQSAPPAAAAASSSSSSSSSPPNMGIKKESMTTASEIFYGVSDRDASGAADGYSIDKLFGLCDEASLMHDAVVQATDVDAIMIRSLAVYINTMHRLMYRLNHLRRSAASFSDAAIEVYKTKYNTTQKIQMNIVKSMKKAMDSGDTIQGWIYNDKLTVILIPEIARATKMDVARTSKLLKQLPVNMKETMTIMMSMADERMTMFLMHTMIMLMVSDESRSVHTIFDQFHENDDSYKKAFSDNRIMKVLYSNYDAQHRKYTSLYKKNVNMKVEDLLVEAKRFSWSQTISHDLRISRQYTIHKLFDVMFLHEGAMVHLYGTAEFNDDRTEHCLILARESDSDTRRVDQYYVDWVTGYLQAVARGRESKQKVTITAELPLVVAPKVVNKKRVRQPVVEFNVELDHALAMMLIVNKVNQM